jgi:hypothetical protein
VESRRCGDVSRDVVISKLPCDRIRSHWPDSPRPDSRRRLSGRQACHRLCGVKKGCGSAVSQWHVVGMMLLVLSVCYWWCPCVGSWCGHEVFLRVSSTGPHHEHTRTTQEHIPNTARTHLEHIVVELENNVFELKYIVFELENMYSSSDTGVRARKQHIRARKQCVRARKQCVRGVFEVYSSRVRSVFRCVRGVFMVVSWRVPVGFLCSNTSGTPQ